MTDLMSSNEPIQSLTLTRPDDWHLHLRDGPALKAVVGYSAREFARAIVMPNLKPPVVTAAQAGAYRERILAALAAQPMGAASLTPLMTLYLTDNTTAQTIREAKHCGFVHGVKLYPAGATTHSDSGVTDVARCAAALEAMQALDMPLLVHGEVADPQVDMFDREAVFIERVLEPLRRDFPQLRVVFEHITTQHAVDYVREAPGRIGATITAQHLLFDRNAMFVAPSGGACLRPHYFCLPVLKREHHRKALLAAATSGHPRFFLGTDSAPHERGAKEQACGCAGCFTAVSALALYAAAFESVDALDRLEGFASFFGADFYGLPRNTQRVQLKRAPWRLPESVPYGEGTLVPLAAGECLQWQFCP